MGLAINRALIKAKVPQDEILAQTAEEAAELAQACLKLRRAIRGDNPTPVSSAEATQDLLEEWADVLLCMQLLGDDYIPYQVPIENYMIYKAQRWADRLNAVQTIHEGGDDP